MEIKRGYLYIIDFNPQIKTVLRHEVWNSLACCALIRLHYKGGDDDGRSRDIFFRVGITSTVGSGVTTSGDREDAA
jgi:hypothetical protein